jgi:hypothetical protein
MPVRSMLIPPRRAAACPRARCRSRTVPWARGPFDTNVRYTRISLGFRLANIIGGITPMIATSLAAAGVGNRGRYRLFDAGLSGHDWLRPADEGTGRPCADQPKARRNCSPVSGRLPPAAMLTNSVSGHSSRRRASGCLLSPLLRLPLRLLSSGSSSQSKLEIARSNLPIFRRHGAARSAGKGCKLLEDDRRRRCRRKRRRQVAAPRSPRET